MENTMPLLNVGRKAALGNYASTPGTGPKGAFCSGCSLLHPEGSRFVCRQFQVLTGRKGKPISSGSAACKYFEKRRAFNISSEG